jgi:hypothetical protein
VPINPLLLLVVLLMLVGIGFTIVRALHETRGKPRRIRLVRLAAIALFAVGAAGFFGSFIAANGGMSWLPSTVELPAGRVSGVVTMADGTRVVPLPHAGRVQLYDGDWRFQRGWQVDAAGGTFVVDALGDGTIQVVTARLQRKYEFDRDGHLLSSRPSGDRDFDEFRRKGHSEVVPTNPLLWVWSGPFASWLTMMAGIVLMNLADKRKPRRKGGAGASG